MCEWIGTYIIQFTLIWKGKSGNRRNKSEWVFVKSDLKKQTVTQHVQSICFVNKNKKIDFTANWHTPEIEIKYSYWLSNIYMKFDACGESVLSCYSLASSQRAPVRPSVTVIPFHILNKFWTIYFERSSLSNLGTSCKRKTDFHLY